MAVADLLPCPRCKADANMCALFYRPGLDLAAGRCEECGWTTSDWDRNLPFGDFQSKLWNRGVEKTRELDQLRQRLEVCDYDAGKKTQTITELKGFIDTLRSRLAEYEGIGAKLALAERDARRWQWFRDYGYKLKAPMCYFDIGCQPDELDQAIDAAIDGSG